jgi:hypothetical protein
MVSLSIATGVYIVIITIIAISIMYAILRWWRWTRQ